MILKLKNRFCLKVLRFIFDTNLTPKQEEILGNYVTQQGLRHESLRDELFCQLVIQTLTRGDEEVRDRAWLLLSNCFSCFAPSHNLASYLVK